MPNGRTHRRATLLLLPVATIAGTLLGEWPGGLGAATGVIATLVINPDLDLLENSLWAKLRRDWAPRWARRRLLARLSWLLFVLPFIRMFWLAWWPYSRAFDHRGMGSHAPVISTLIRVLYSVLLMAIPLAPLLFYNFLPPRYLGLWLDQVPEAGYVGLLGGLVASDTLHYIMDVTTTEIKRLF